MSLYLDKWSHTMQKENPVKVGTLLVAAPWMDDPNFARKVVLITRYEKEGIDGVVINEPLAIRLQEIVPSFPLGFDTKVFLGGPVGQEFAQCVHTQGQLLPDSKKIDEGVYWGGDFDQIKKHVRQSNIDPKHIRFYVGYAGWEAGQLEEEIAQDFWVKAEGANEAIFYTPPSEVWSKTLEKLGGIYKTMLNYPVDPSLN